MSAITTASENGESMNDVVQIDIPEGLEALARRYLTSRHRELSLFQTLLESANYEEIRRLSHNLKGTGASYGFPDVTRLGSAIERASKERDSSGISQQMIALSHYVNSAVRQLQLIP